MVISPSLYNSDLYLLADNLKRLQQLDITHLHIDVMDSHYVPSVGFSPNFVVDLKKHTSFILDCHLMVEKPEDRVTPFIEAGADIVTFHYEATCQHMFIIHLLKKHHVKVGIAINPGTPIESLSMLLPFLDLILVMTVNPGRSGEVFIPMTLDKIVQLTVAKNQYGYNYTIQVDGNVTDKTILACINAGASNIVSGGFIFQNNNLEHNMAKLQQAINRV